MGRRNENKNSGNCCSWPVAISFLILCVICGILVWQLVPWDDIIGNLIPDFEDNSSGYTTDRSPSPTLPPSPNPTYSPSTEPLPFNRCNNSKNSTSCCNGLESNCAMRVNELMYATSHNAMSSKEDSFTAANHLKRFEESLQHGYRALMFDLCDCGNDGLQLCHSLCIGGKRNPITAFDAIKSFLDQNPQEVIILIFEIGKDFNGNESIPLTNLRTIMESVPGLTEILYVHPTTAAEWPTMQELIDNNQRLIVFHHGGNVCTPEDCPKGFHYYFHYVVETPFYFSSELSIMEHDTSCVLDRGEGGLKDFYGVNNFVTQGLPMSSVAKNVNNKIFLYDHIDACEQLSGLNVNFVSVDFWSIGNLPEVVQNYNSGLDDKL